MNLVTLDFETFYSRTYKLSKLTTEAYINDPQFQIIGVALQVNDGPPKWFSSPRPADYARALAPLQGAAVICHNTPFDAAILSWRLGIRPRFLLDTLSMARAWYGNHVGNSLEVLAQRLGLPPKGKEVLSAEGKRLEDFTPDELAAYGAYCRNDVALTRGAFDAMRGHFSAEELRKMDIVLRMYTDPVLRLDKATIRREIELETTRKAALLARIGDLGGEKGSNLSSNEKFAQVLQSLGVNPPTKLSPKQKNPDGSPKRVWAFAKGDADFRALLDHEDATVQAAVEARLGIKSTQKETRAATFLGIAERNDDLFPVALAPSAAHTHRLGGYDKQNMTNLPGAREGDENSGLLRKSICAPPAHLIVVGDMSQIEARLLVTIADQSDKIDGFAQKRDVYSEQASVIFGRPIDRKHNPADKIPGAVGKATILGAGFGLGHMSFGAKMYVGFLGAAGITFDAAFAENLGVDPAAYYYWLMDNEERLRRAKDMRPLALDEDAWFCHLSCSKHIIDVFRSSNPRVPALWKKGDEVLQAMLDGRSMTFGGPDNDILQVEGASITLPGWLSLQYPALEQDKKGQFSCLRRKEGRVQRIPLWGGVITENVMQYLSAYLIGKAMVRIERAGAARGWRQVLQVYDEIATVVPEPDTDYAIEVVRQILCTAPRWAPHMPLAADVSSAQRYGEAK